MCTKTFTRKGKKFGAAPELEAPEDLEPLPSAAGTAKDKGEWCRSDAGASPGALGCNTTQRDPASLFIAFLASHSVPGFRV